MTQSRPRLPDGQDPLIDCMKSSGHTSLDDGVCHGVAHKGMFAILGETLNSFDETMELIYASKADFSAVHANTEVTALLDRVTVFQYPEFHKGLLPPDINNISQANSSEYFIPLLLTPELEEAGGIAMISKVTGTGTESSLSAYFSSLAKIINESGITKPIALVFANCSHAITLGYLPQQRQWVLINANNLPCEYINTTEQALLAKKVMGALMYSQTTAVFSIEAFVRNDTRQEYKKCLKKWKRSREWKVIHIATSKNRDAKNDENVTWLHIAAKMGLTEQVKQLIACGANLNIRRIGGTSTIHMAALHGNMDIVKLLLDNGANPDIGGRENDTPLHVAADEGLEDLATLLLTHNANPECTNNDGFTPLHMAAMQGHGNIVKLLLEYDVDINKKSNDGSTALYMAVANNGIALLEMLIENGADVNLAYEDGITLLSAAVEAGDEETVKLLIANGADVNLARNDGATPLFIAAQLGDKDLVSLLLQNGADASISLYQPETTYIEFARDINQETEARMNQFLIAEFHNSSIQRNSASVSGFIKWSFFNTINSNMPRMLSVDNYYSMTPLQIAEIMGHEDIAVLLRTHCEKSSLSIATRMN